jgi:hypothetical protein
MCTHDPHFSLLREEVKTLMIILPSKIKFWLVKKDGLTITNLCFPECDVTTASCGLVSLLVYVLF